MLDEFYRKCAISIEDIDGSQHRSTESDLRVHRSPMSIPAKRVIIKRPITDDEVRSQYLSIVSPQPDSPKAYFEKEKSKEYTDCQALEPPSPRIECTATVHLSSDVLKSPYGKYNHDRDQIKVFFENRSLSLAADFDDVYAALETQFTLDTAAIEDLRVRNPDIDLHATGALSWSTFSTNKGLGTPRWSSGFSEDIEVETGSVIAFDPQPMIADEEVVGLYDHDEEDHSTLLAEESICSNKESQPRSLQQTRSIRGFPGRFSMAYTDQISWLGNDMIQHKFGLTYHPNGRITNKAFIKDPRYQITSLDEADIMHDAVLGAAIRHAEITAAKLEPLKQILSLEEVILRREIHRECALARLEGVSVGYFRYFAGHMTVEEYLAGRICVCWSDCFCNKLCTRFGDMLCPCSENLEISD